MGRGLAYIKRGVYHGRPKLVELKILAEITGQARNRRFRYDAYVRLFDEEAGT